MEFDLISSLKHDKQETWEKCMFLTFDIDWAAEFVIEDTLSLIKNTNTTIFVTHESKLLKSLAKNSNVELGIHPNFNPLLSGDSIYGNSIEKVIDYYLNLVPRAKSVRSHSMTQNSHILEMFKLKGLQYDCNHFIPYYSNIMTRPWLHWDKTLVKVPYFWEDDVQCLFDDTWNISIEQLIGFNGIKVFDFHPIHIYLNTEKIERYEAAKPYLNDQKKIKDFINKDVYGTRNFLIDLLKRSV